MMGLRAADELAPMNAWFFWRQEGALYEFGSASISVGDGG
jgi:hypothetical protein